MFFDLPIDMIGEVMNHLLSFDMRKLMINLILLGKSFDKNLLIFQREKEERYLILADQMYSLSSNLMKMSIVRGCPILQINRYLRDNLGADLSNNNLFAFYWRLKHSEDDQYFDPKVIKN